MQDQATHHIVRKKRGKEEIGRRERVSVSLRIKERERKIGKV